jgi:hypothetical protein
MRREETLDGTGPMGGRDMIDVILQPLVKVLLAKYNKSQFSTICLKWLCESQAPEIIPRAC